MEKQRTRLELEYELKLTKKILERISEINNIKSYDYEY